MEAMSDPTEHDSPWVNCVTLIYEAPIDETPFYWCHGPLYDTDLIRKTEL